MRQAILEGTMVASFQVDGVLAEISNEHAHLFELGALLQARRDRAVNLANVANLITGTGLGIAVNALQFSNLCRIRPGLGQLGLKLRAPRACARAVSSVFRSVESIGGSRFCNRRPDAPAILRTL
jgi:hypothetical protein